MGADGGEDRAESYRRECKKRISKVYGKKLKFVPNVPHVPIQNVIVYAEISDDRRYGFLHKLRKGRFASAERSFFVQKLDWIKRWWYAESQEPETG